MHGGEDGRLPESRASAASQVSLLDHALVGLGGATLPEAASGEEKALAGKRPYNSCLTKTTSLAMLGL